MPSKNPSQYECDLMEKGDIVYVQKRTLFYKFYRNLFHKDFIKIKVRTDFGPNPTYKEYYQEDCTILYYSELQCIQNFEDEVPCKIMFGKKSIEGKETKLKKLIIGVNNIQIIFGCGIGLIIPTKYFSTGINQNNIRMQQVEYAKTLEQHMKYCKYDANYFRDVVKKKNIKEWDMLYCHLCGKPTKAVFNNDDTISINNHCICETLDVNKDKVSYEDFAIWFNSITEPLQKKRNEDFWILK